MAILKYVHGDLLLSEAQVLVNTVNCVGVMGKGIALQFKRAHPDMFRSYRKACLNGEVRPGKPHIYRAGHKVIFNFPTKDHWRSPSEYEYIVLGLVALVSFLQNGNYTSIAVPPLGCGNGGLSWDVVKVLLATAMEHVDGVTVYVYEPSRR